MRVAVVGMGNLGSAVANHLARNGHDILAWEFNQSVVDEINLQHTNSQYLPEVALSCAIKAYSSLPQLIEQSPELLLITMPSQFIATVFLGLEVDSNIPLVNMSKGIDADSGETVFQYFHKNFPQHAIAQLAGPSIANELSRDVITSFVAASESAVLQKKIATLFNNDYVSIQFSNDVIGVELGGILKNCYALGLGVVDEDKHAGLNFKGSFFSLALQEMSLLAITLGASDKTFSGVSGLGDLLATALSEESHNRKMGKLVAKGLSLKEIKKQLGVLAEGYNSLAAILHLAEKNNVNMPLALLINQLIIKKISITSFFLCFSKLLKSKF